MPCPPPTRLLQRWRFQGQQAQQAQARLHHVPLAALRRRLLQPPAGEAKVRMAEVRRCEEGAVGLQNVQVHGCCTSQAADARKDGGGQPAQGWSQHPGRMLSRAAACSRGNSRHAGSIPSQQLPSRVVGLPQLLRAGGMRGVGQQRAVDRRASGSSGGGRFLENPQPPAAPWKRPACCSPQT
jgi:hypothetical protein